MAHDVTMPQLGMAQDAGKIVSWAKAPGDAVAAGEALFEVETDKAVMEVEAPAGGYLSAVAYGDGAEVPVGAVIARIVADAGEVEAGVPAPEGLGKSVPEAQGGAVPETPPALVVRDLRATPLASVALGAEAAPVLTITDRGTDRGADRGTEAGRHTGGDMPSNGDPHAGPALSITLECAARALDAGAAIRCLTDFAGRVEQPLRHLL